MPNNDTGEKLIKELLSDNSKVQPFGKGYENVFTVNGGMENFYSSITAGLDKIAKDYISNPDTRVFINYNNDMGNYQHSIQVQGTDFWLTSFDTEQEALQYIEENGLVKAD